MFEIFLFAVGSCFGSCALAIGHRLCQSEDIISKRSYARCCGKNLKISNLVPILSYIWLRGKCGFCKTKIPIKYFIIECLCGLFFLLVLKNGIKSINIGYALIIFLLAIHSVTDLLERSIFTSVTIVIFILMILMNIVLDQKSIITSIFTTPLLLTGIIYIISKICSIIKKRKSIGLGDLELIFVLSIGMSITKALIFILFIGMIGVLFGVLWKMYNRRKLYFPFVPAISLSFAIVVLYGGI